MIESETNSRNSKSAEHVDSGNGDEDQMRSDVENFRKEVELKFVQSRTNQQYRFPRRAVGRLRQNSRQASFDSLENVTFYDLDSQNVKFALLEKSKQAKQPNPELLVEVVRRLGKLDPRYLASQFRSSKSTLFRILKQSVPGVQKDRQSMDTLKPRLAQLRTETLVSSRKRPASRQNEVNSGSGSHILLSTFKPKSLVKTSQKLGSPTTPFSINSSHASFHQQKRKAKESRSRCEPTETIQKQSGGSALLISARHTCTRSHADLQRIVTRAHRPVASREQTPTNARNASAREQLSALRRSKEALQTPKAAQPSLQFAGHSRRKETFKKFIINYKKQ